MVYTDALIVCIVRARSRIPNLFHQVYIAAQHQRQCAHIFTNETQINCPGLHARQPPLVSSSTSCSAIAAAMKYIIYFCRLSRSLCDSVANHLSSSLYTFVSPLSSGRSLQNDENRGIIFRRPFECYILFHIMVHNELLSIVKMSSH